MTHAVIILANYLLLGFMGGCIIVIYDDTNSDLKVRPKWLLTPFVILFWYLMEPKPIEIYPIAGWIGLLAGVVFGNRLFLAVARRYIP